MKSRTIIVCFGACGLAVLSFPSLGAPLDETPPERPARVVSLEGSDREARQPQVAVDPRGRIYVTLSRGLATSP